MTHSIYTASDARRFFGTDITREPTRDELIALGAASVEREADNAGTFVLNELGMIIGYVPNSYSDGELWLYYSSDVSDWLGLTPAADPIF